MSVQASSFVNVIDILDQLPRLVHETRHILKLSEREAAAQIGVSQGQLHRFELGGRDWTESTLRAVLVWLDRAYPGDVRVVLPDREGVVTDPVEVLRRQLVALQVAVAAVDGSLSGLPARASTGPGLVAVAA